MTSTLRKDTKKDVCGPRATVYTVKRDPSLARDDYIKDKTKPAFGFVGGSSYKGNWRGNNKEGFGIEVCSDNTKYEGEWLDNKRHGRGTLWVKKGKKYVKQYAGEWAFGKKSGFGIYSYEDGSIYKGQWEKNVRCGQGQHEFSNGDVYKGEWWNDTRHGPGSLYLVNGNIYEGHWVHDMKEGPGRYFYAATGKVYEGEWVEDCPRCGEFRDPTEDEVSRFGDPQIPKATFDLPEIALENVRSVVDCAVAATRTARADYRGMGSSDLADDALQRAEDVFSSLDTAHKGVVAFSSLGEVFKALGAHFSTEAFDDIMSQLDICGTTEISFPETVDIATFYRGY